VKDIRTLVKELQEAELYLSAAEQSEEHARQRVCEHREKVRDAQRALVTATLHGVPVSRECQPA
jgi:hypothetical protein